MNDSFLDSMIKVNYLIVSYLLMYCLHLWLDLIHFLYLCALLKIQDILYLPSPETNNHFYINLLKFSLHIYHVHGTMQGTKDTIMNKRFIIPELLEFAYLLFISYFTRYCSGIQYLIPTHKRSQFLWISMNHMNKIIKGDSQNRIDYSKLFY